MKTPTQNIFATITGALQFAFSEATAANTDQTLIDALDRALVAARSLDSIAGALESASLYLTGSGRHCAQVADEHAQAESGAAILAGNAQTRELESVIADVEAARALLGSDQSARDALLLYTFQLPARISLRSHKSAVLDVAGNVLAMFDEGEDEARQARELCRVLNAAHRAGIVENATEDSGQ